MTALAEVSCVERSYGVLSVSVRRPKKIGGRCWRAPDFRYGARRQVWF
jgi:hypothetical protein